MVEALRKAVEDLRDLALHRTTRRGSTSEYRFFAATCDRHLAQAVADLLKSDYAFFEREWNIKATATVDEAKIALKGHFAIRDDRAIDAELSKLVTAIAAIEAESKGLWTADAWASGSASQPESLSASHDAQDEPPPEVVQGFARGHYVVRKDGLKVGAVPYLPCDDRGSLVEGSTVEVVDVVALDGRVRGQIVGPSMGWITLADSQGSNVQHEERARPSCVPGEEERCIIVSVTTMGGASVSMRAQSSWPLQALKLEVQRSGGPRVRDQRLILGGAVLDNDQADLDSLAITDGCNITLICSPFCFLCKGPCACADCHGEGRYGDGCTSCRHVRANCPTCHGPCKCSQCHGRGYGNCRVCGARDPCWGGDSLVLLPGGAAKKVRECRVGDEVRTLKGVKRIARIWSQDPAGGDEDTEVCCLSGVWITSHHPVISGDDWVFPAELVATAPWHKRRHVVPDMYNFELEGHDDTILLWGGASHGLLTSCTIGKHLGPRFGSNVCTRRSTRCKSACRQCDEVYVEGMRFDKIPASMRWRTFPDFPQVEWPNRQLEFQLAEAARKSFTPRRIASPSAKQQ